MPVQALGRLTYNRYRIEVPPELPILGAVGFWPVYSMYGTLISPYIFDQKLHRIMKCERDLSQSVI